MDDPKPEVRDLPECHEGPEAASSFSALVKKVVTASPAEIKKQEAKWKQQDKPKRGRGVKMWEGAR